MMTKPEHKKLWAETRNKTIKRDGYKCAVCDATKNKKGKRIVLHLSHLFPRSLYRFLTYDIDNVVMMCYKCHLKFWHISPIDAYKWYIKHVPYARRKRLEKKAYNQP